MTSRCRTIAIAFILLLSLGATKHAMAQAMPGVPEPITTPELMDHADTLALSPEQRIAILPIHDEYLRRFSRLRDDDITEFQNDLLDEGMKFMQNRPGRGGTIYITPRKTIEDLFVSYDRLLDRVDQVDQSLFNQMLPVLTDEQVARLDRVRTERRIEVYGIITLEMTGEFNQGVRPDLAEFVDRLELSPEQSAELDPILRDYQNTRLAQVKRMWTKLREAANVVLDLIDQLGLRGMTIEQAMATAANPELLVSLQTTFNEASKPFQSLAHDMSRTNWTTYQRIMRVLDDEEAAKLQDRYFSSAYRRSYAGQGQWRDRYQRALRLEQLSTDQREAIEAQRAEFDRQNDSILRRIASTHESWREYRTFEAMNSGGEHPPDADALRDERRELDERAIRAVDSILGPDLVAALDRAKDEEKKQKEEEAAARTQVVIEASGGPGGVRTETRVERSESRRNRDPFGTELFIEPEPFALADLEQMMNALELPDATRSILSAMYDDYRAEFDAELEAVASTADEDDEGESAEEPNQAERAQAAENLDRTFTAIDDRFFENVSLVASSESEDIKRRIDHFHRMRMRSVAGAQVEQLTFAFGNEEAFLDLAQVVLDCDAARAHQNELRTVLDSYDQRVTGVYVDRVDLARNARRRFQMMQKAGGGANNAVQQRLAESWQESRRAMQKAHLAVTDLNREHLDLLLAALPDDAAWELRYAYNRAAYPDIYEDSQRMEDRFRAALAIADLSAAQRDQINELSADYRSRYFALSEEMVGHRQERDFDFLGGEVPERSAIENEITLERLRFAREELGDRANLHLKLTLNDLQIQQVPGLR